MYIEHVIEHVLFRRVTFYIRMTTIEKTKYESSKPYAQLTCGG